VVTYLRRSLISDLSSLQRKMKKNYEQLSASN